jgi:hypothetical protein
LLGGGSSFTNYVATKNYGVNNHKGKDDDDIWFIFRLPNDNLCLFVIINDYTICFIYAVLKIYYFGYNAGEGNATYCFLKYEVKFQT